MKTALKRLWRYIEGINGLLLILYCIFSFSAYAFFIADTSVMFFLRWVLLITVVSVLVCPLILRAVRKIGIRSELAEKDSHVKWVVLFFGVPFVLFLAKYIIYFPGALSNDSVKQYTQAVSGTYNDWHPVFQTLLAIKLPLLLTGGWIGSISLFQIVGFSLALGYSLLTVKKVTNARYAVLMLLFVMLNPQTTNIALYPWKDVSFAIGALLLLTFVLQIWFTDGAWIRNPWHLAAFVAAWVCTTLFRHNAVLFTVPLLIAVFFPIARKTALIMCVCAGALIAGIKFPLYSVLGVQSLPQRQVEMLGLPMTVIGAAVTYSPEKLDEEILDFAYQVAPREVWEKEYQYGNYNDVKWDPQTNNEVIEQYGPGRVVGMAFRCLKESPYHALKGLIKLTDVVYTVTDDYEYYELPGIAANPYGIQTKGIPALQKVNEKVTWAVYGLFPRLFMYFGSMHLILLIGVLAKCRLNKWKDWKKILIVLPLFIYNFGTALLLTGAPDSSRFFYYTFLLTPILLVFLFAKKKENERNVTSA